MLISATAIYVAIFTVVFLLMASSTVVITQQQHVKIISTFGRFSSVRKSGLSFKAPWPFQAASENFSLKIREISEDVNVKSSDNAFVLVPIRVQFCVDENTAQDAFYKLNNPEGQIRSYVVNQVRSTASSLSFNQLFQARDTFEDGVEGTLTEKMSGFGFRIENVLVDDPQPSEDLRQAFDRVIASERLKEAAINEGEAAKTLSIAKSKAEGEAMNIKAEAYASFRKKVAEGNAEALQAFVGSTGLSASAGLDFFTSINEMEALRDAASAGGSVVFVTAAAKETKDPATMGMIAAGQQTKAPAKNRMPRKSVSSLSDKS